MDVASKISADLAILREKRPLVHSITNLVVMNETANAILCIGGLPIMSHAIEEVAEMVGAAGALVLNIGTLTPDWIDAMEVAGRRANELSIPVVMDPVGAGATRLRTDSCLRLLERVRIAIVRGNAAELASLAGLSAEIRGVESVSVSEESEQITRKFARAFGCTAALTGPVDTVSDGQRLARVSNGHAMLGEVVGTGCIASVIVAAFAAVELDPVIAAAGGLAAMGIAGEDAAAISGERPGTFHVELYNALYALSGEDLQPRVKVELSQAG